jgi:uncharacterized small protein (DUF1192 family)
MSDEASEAAKRIVAELTDRYDVGLYDSVGGYSCDPTWVEASEKELSDIVIKNVTPLLAAKDAEIERLREELDAKDCSHEDEIASHQETLLLWESSKARIAELEQQVAALRADADRWRYMLSHAGRSFQIAFTTPEIPELPEGEHVFRFETVVDEIINAAIDAARTSDAARE